MQIHRNHSHVLRFPVLTLLALTAGFGLSVSDRVLAQTTAIENQPTSGVNVAQATSTPAPKPTQPGAAGRLKPTFFEEDIGRPRFGRDDYRSSALDNNQGSFGDPAKVSKYFPSRKFGKDFVNPMGTRSVDGTVFAERVDGDLDSVSLVGDDGQVLLANNVRQGATPQEGTLDVLPGSTLLPPGRYNYSAGFINNGETGSGAILISDPNNPGRSVFIQVPPQNVPGIRDDDSPVTGRASYTSGIPIDR